MAKLKILLVDDSEDILNELSKILEDIPTVEIVGKAVDEAQALKLFRSYLPDLVCLDIRLQKGDGFSILEKIKMEKPGTVVLMITNYPYRGYRKKSLDLGAEFFFDKSKDFPQIEQIVKDLAGSTVNRS